MATITKTARGRPSPPTLSGSPFTSPEYRKAMQKTEDCVAGDLPTDIAIVWRWKMAAVHQSYMNAFERVYCFADEGAQAKQDSANYLGFAEVSIFHIISHHQNEETDIFPVLAQRTGNNIWSRNVEQHEQFSEQLGLTWLYIRHCRSQLSPDPPSPVPEPLPEIKALDKSKFPILDFSKPFNPEAFRKHIDSYVLVLVDHLAQELDTLTPEIMCQITAADDKLINDQLGQHVKAMDPKWFLCSTLGSMPPRIARQFFPLPYVVRRIIVPFVYAPKYWGFWKYCGYIENLTWSGTA